MAVSMPMIPAAGIDPLAGAAKWYRLMAENGITATTDHTFAGAVLPLASALASQHDSPLRLSPYHMATDNKANKPLPHGASNDMLRKVGIKIWADGSPWVGNIAATYPYLDNETVHAAGIPVGPTRESALNYTPAELDDLLDSFSDDDWQFAVHVNGDYALDVVLHSYQRELTRCALLGTDIAGASSTSAVRAKTSSSAPRSSAWRSRWRRSSSSTGATSSTARSSRTASARSGSASPMRWMPGHPSASTTTAP